MRYALAVVPLFLLGLLVMPVAAAVTISPSNATVLLGFPAQFTVSGLNSTLSYTYEIDGVAQGELSVTTDGKATIVAIFTESGVHSLSVKQGGTTVAVANVNVLDVMVYLIPAVTLIIMVTVVMGLIKQLKF